MIKNLDAAMAAVLKGGKSPKTETTETKVAPGKPAVKPAKKEKAAPAPKPEKAPKPAKVTAPKAPKAPKPVKVKAPKAPKVKDPNSALSNNFRLFAMAGRSTYKDVSKLWFANETAVRVKNMVKMGHTDIDYIELPQPMTKADALAYLAANPTMLPADVVASKNERFNLMLKRRAKKQALATPVVNDVADAAGEQVAAS